MAGPHYSIPPQPTPFVGREHEIAAIGKMLVDAGHRLITVLGPGGIGKTRLSLAVAEGQLAANAFGDGIFFVPLAGLEDSERIVSVIADAMQLRLEQGEPQLLSYLRAKQILILLDNFEHLLDGSGLVARMLQAAPGLRMLVTSRERLRLQGEQVYPIRGLTVDDEAAMDDARRLFLQAAGRIHPGFQQTSENLPWLNRICSLVEGMPLALELAAAWVDLLTLGDIAAEIERNLGFLETDLRDMPARHRSMRAVFDTSWQNLSPEQQKLMAQVSDFRGGFTREAAESVAGASLRHLAALANKSLLMFDAAANRYQLHELLRQYGAGQMSSVEGQERHAAYYLDWLIQRSGKLTGPERDETMAQFDLEMDNLRAALNHALLLRQVDRFVPVMRTLAEFYACQSRQGEGVLLFDLIRTELASDSEARPRILFWAIALQVSALGSIGKATLAHELWREGQAILADLASQGEDCRQEHAYADYVEGYRLYADRPSESRQLLQHSHDLWIACGDPLSAGRALTVQARAARNQGDLAAASAAASAALKLFQTLNDRHSVISIQLLSGNLAAIAGRYDEAERRLQAGIDAERSLNRPWTLANSGLGKLQMVYFFSGRFQQALAPLAEYRQLSEEYGFAWGLAQSGISMGLLHLHLGEYANGQKQGENILGQIKEHGLLDFFACETLALLAQVKIALGEFEAAGAYLQECDALCDTRPVGMPTYVAGNHLYWGIIAAVEGDLAAAWEHLQSELESAVARKDRLNMANALGGGAFLYAMGNEASPALEHYSLAFQHPFVANSRWFEELIGKRVQSACESLSAAEAEAIRVRASGMDLEASAATMLAQWKSPSAKKPVAAIAGAQPLLDPPSQRELELLQLVAEGKSNREIAAELFLALGTVKSHLHNIYQKLGASNRTQAINRAKELGLL